MEYITFISILLLVLLLASYSAITAGNGITNDNEITDARRIAFTVAQEINIASRIGSGYSHKFSLPELLSGGSNYSVNFSETRFVYILWNNKSYSLPVLAQNITGAVQKNSITIRNLNDVITFV